VSVGWIATRRPASAPPASMHIAVLPFKVLTSDPAEKTWGIGLADAIIARLANFNTLRVRPTTSVFKYDADTSDPQKAGAELGAEHVLTGTLHKRERDYRITLVLTQTSNGAAIWGDSYDVPHRDLPSIDDRVAAEVAEALRVKLSATERAHRRAATNPAAFELYLQARGLMDVQSEARLLASIDAYKKSLDIDPQYALAHAGLATALSWFSLRYEHEPEALKWGQLADDAAYRALTLDPDLAEAHLAMASTAGTLYGHFNWGRVLAESDAAIALDARTHLAYSIRGRALYHLGLFDAANRAIATSLSLNPAVETQRVQVAADLFAGRFNDVRARSEALIKEATTPVLRTYLGTALFYLGERQRSADMLASVTRGNQPDARSQAVLAGVLAASGKNVEALATIDRLIRGPYMDHHVAYSLAAAYAQLRRPSDVVIWLRKAYDEGFPCYPWFERDPMLDPVRQQQAFTDLMRELRSRFEAARSQYGDATH
jgi:TolB-like protein/Flp pilus assembly protein TadD